MLKLNRNYSLTIQPFKGDALTITPPLSLQLDVHRSQLGSSNYCQVRVYNLTQKKRNAIYFNIFDSIGFYRKLTLQAGYGDNLPVIFIGNINQAWSVREGVNYITQIESQDGSYSYLNAQYSGPAFLKGTKTTVVISTLMQSLSKNTFIEFGGIDETMFPGTIPKDTVYSGDTIRILQQLTNYNFFIDLGKCYAMNPNSYIEVQSAPAIPTIVIDKTTGLINSPFRERNVIKLEMVFEPSLEPGRRVQITSLTFPEANGIWITKEVTHRGIISPSVGGNLITTATFLKPANPTPVTKRPITQ